MEAGGVADSLLSGACVLFTLAMYSTGLSDLRQMRMTRSVDSVQFLPFLTTDINNLSWMSYGALKGDGTLIFVNATGAVLQTLYILVYLHYCPRKQYGCSLPCSVRCSFRLQPCWGSFSWVLATFGSWCPTLRPGFSSWASSAVSSPSACTSHHWLTWPRSFRRDQPSVSPSHSPLPPSSPLPPGPCMGFG
ncbi:sugar transporter SWEET1 isoform X3 [Mirounga angustirostris]|uniref:sugar transporter SWEET1 isoform X3 n=1 Tax=Mirounga angustirostris TaxID=9716 RepID=UPI001E686461|nr:sugar transporter SWEET1 isoform X3 [Mirounga angustirostris]